MYIDQPRDALTHLFAAAPPAARICCTWKTGTIAQDGTLCKPVGRAKPLVSKNALPLCCFPSLCSYRVRCSSNPSRNRPAAGRDSRRPRDRAGAV